MTTHSVIQTDTVPILNRMFRLQWEPAQESYVLLYPEGMVQLNGPAGEILALVDGQRRIADIIETLEAKFAGVEGIASDIIEFLGDAHEQHWITL